MGLAACDFGLSGLSGGTAEADAGAAEDSSVPVPPPPTDAAGDAAAPNVPSFVQSVAAASYDASLASATFEAGVSPGDTIIVAFDYGEAGGPPVSVNDTQNDTFTPLIDWIGGNGSHFAVSAAVGVVGGPTNVTAQVTTETRGIELYVHEYAGVSAAGVSAGANGSSNAVDGVQTPLLTTTVPNELVFAYGVSGIVKPGTGFTARSTFHGNLTEEKIAATPGSYRGVATMTQGTGWTLVAATFKPR
jgi:hypothetical protein